MSANTIPLNLTTVIDPRVAVNSERHYAVLKSGAQNYYKVWPSTSYSQSSIAFSTPPPSNTTLICTNIYMGQSYLFNFTGSTPDGSNLLKLGTDDGPASFLNCKAIQTLQNTVNGTSITSNYNDLYPYLFRYEQFTEYGRYDMSGTTDMLDNYQNLSDWQTLGSNRNPLALFGENAVRVTRGGFAGIFVLSNTSTSASIRVLIVEPLIVPGVLNTDDTSLHASLMHLQSQDWNFTLTNNIVNSNLWSHATNANTVNSTVTFNDLSAPFLIMNYIGIDSLTPIQGNLVYPYTDIQRYPTTIGVITSGSQFTANSSSITLNSCPRSIMVFVRQSNSTLDMQSTDTFAGISNIQVNINSRNALLASAPQFSLWNICRKNGLNLSYSEFTKYVGSPILLDFNEDLMTGSDPYQCSGVLGQIQLQIQVTGTNLSARDLNLTLYIVTLNDGCLNLSDNVALLNTNVLTKEDIFKSNVDSVYSSDYTVYRKLMGRGALTNKLSNIVKQVGKVVKAAPKAIHEGAKLIREGREAYNDVRSAIEGHGRLTREDLKRNMRHLE